MQAVFYCMSIVHTGFLRPEVEDFVVLVTYTELLSLKQFAKGLYFVPIL